MLIGDTFWTYLIFDAFFILWVILEFNLTNCRFFRFHRIKQEFDYIYLLNKLDGYYIGVIV